MRKTIKNKQKGFTLIELLVVISVIALLSSIVLGSLNTARKKASDVKIVAQLQSLQKAIEINYLNTNSYPGSGQSIWASDYCGDTSFTQGVLQQLVTNRIISSIPNHPTNDSCTSGFNNYVYFTDYEFSSAQPKCGGKPIKDYMLINASNGSILKGLGMLEYYGDLYPEYHCIGN